LRPYKPQYPGHSKDLSKIINIISEDDVGESCFTEELDYLEIGVHVKKNLIKMAALDPQTESQDYIIDDVPYSKPSEIIMIISEFMEEILKNSTKRIASVKIGIVQENLELIPGIEELGSVALAQDLHAIALLSQDSLHSHTVIVVINEGTLRSCVVHKGKILCGEEGESLGDLRNIKVSELAQAVGMLLALFGPAAVILAGEDYGESLNAFIGKVKQYVPGSIWKKSIVRESLFKSAAAAQAASKLHYLNFKYKFAM
jgi:hypothetical protein